MEIIISILIPVKVVFDVLIALFGVLFLFLLFLVSLAAHRVAQSFWDNILSGNSVLFLHEVY